jgi:hypothetical protein
VYDELWNQAPPQETKQQRGAISRARGYARARGWLGPLAWDDDLIDLPPADLEAELARRAEAMTDEEVAACHTAAYRHGDRSPLVLAGAREASRRRKAKAAASKGAAA